MPVDIYAQAKLILAEKQWRRFNYTATLQGKGLELIRRCEVVKDDEQALCLEYLNTIYSYDTPRAGRKTYSGVWRVVKNVGGLIKPEGMNLPPFLGIEQTLRWGYLETIRAGAAMDFSEARLVTPGKYAPFNVRPGAEMLVVWPNIAFGKIKTCADSVTDTAIDPVIQGETYTGTWRRKTVEAHRIDDGSGEVAVTYRLDVTAITTVPNVMDFTNARILRPGEYAPFRVQPGADLVVAWFSIAPSYLKACAASVAATLSSPVIETETYAGTWYRKTVSTQIAEDGSGVVVATYRLEVTTILASPGVMDFTNARLLKQGEYEAFRVPPGAGLVVAWFGIAPTSVQACAASVTATLSAPVIQGETYAGTWHRKTVTGQQADDGGGVVVAVFRIEVTTILTSPGVMDFTNARFLKPAEYNAFRVEPGAAMAIAWFGVVPTSLKACADSVTATLSGPVIMGETFTGTWYRKTVTMLELEDGSGLVVATFALEVTTIATNGVMDMTNARLLNGGKYDPLRPELVICWFAIAPMAIKACTDSVTATLSNPVIQGETYNGTWLRKGPVEGKQVADGSGQVIATFAIEPEAVEILEGDTASETAKRIITRLDTREGARAAVAAAVVPVTGKVRSGGVQRTVEGFEAHVGEKAAVAQATAVSRATTSASSTDATATDRNVAAAATPPTAPAAPSPETGKVVTDVVEKSAEYPGTVTKTREERAAVAQTTAVSRGTRTATEKVTVITDRNVAAAATPPTAPAAPNPVNGKVVTDTVTKSAEFPGTVDKTHEEEEAVARNAVFLYPGVDALGQPLETALRDWARTYENISDTDLQAILDALPVTVTGNDGFVRELHYSVSPGVSRYPGLVTAHVRRSVGAIINNGTNAWLNYVSGWKTTFLEQYSRDLTQVRKRARCVLVTQTCDHAAAYAAAYAPLEGDYYCNNECKVEDHGNGHWRAVNVSVANKWGPWTAAQ